MLTISGVARVFVTKRLLLTALGDFQKAWRLLLEHIEKLSLSSTQEVSLAALKSFHEMVVSGTRLIDIHQSRFGSLDLLCIAVFCFLSSNFLFF